MSKDETKWSRATQHVMRNLLKEVRKDGGRLVADHAGDQFGMNSTEEFADGAKRWLRDKSELSSKTIDNADWEEILFQFRALTDWKPRVPMAFREAWKEALSVGEYVNPPWPEESGVSVAQVMNGRLMSEQRGKVTTMQGHEFAPGVVYKNGRDWLQVVTRGTVGERTGTVHMTVRNRAGDVSRAVVKANTEYHVASEFPKRRPRRTQPEDA